MGIEMFLVEEAFTSGIAIREYAKRILSNKHHKLKTLNDAAMKDASELIRRVASRRARQPLGSTSQFMKGLEDVPLLGYLARHHNRTRELTHYFIDYELLSGKRPDNVRVHLETVKDDEQKIKLEFVYDTVTKKRHEYSTRLTKSEALKAIYSAIEFLRGQRYNIVMV